MAETWKVEKIYRDVWTVVNTEKQELGPSFKSSFKAAKVAQALNELEDALVQEDV